MTATTHTPGPWKRNWQAEWGGAIESGNAVLANFLADKVGHDEAEANALLFASAPELVAALSAIAGNRYKSVAGARNRARAALERLKPCRP